MQPIPLEPGMRVRCVDAGRNVMIYKGGEYHVVQADSFGLSVIVSNNSGIWYASDRFKPVVRVTAKCVPSLSVLIKRAVAAVERMTPAERAAMDKAQRESWARGEAGLGLD